MGVGFGKQYDQDVISASLKKSDSNPKRHGASGRGRIRPGLQDERFSYGC